MALSVVKVSEKMRGVELATANAPGPLALSEVRQALPAHCVVSCVISTTSQLTALRLTDH